MPTRKTRTGCFTIGAFAISLVLSAGLGILGSAEAGPAEIGAYARAVAGGARLVSAKRYQAALPFLAKAIEIGEKEFGPEDQNVAKIRNLLNLSKRLASLGQVKKPSASVRQQPTAALREPPEAPVQRQAERFSGSDRVHVADSSRLNLQEITDLRTLERMAGKFRKEGKFGEAEEAIYRAIDVLETSPHEKDYELKLAQENIFLGILLNDQGKIFESRKVLEKYIPIYEKNNKNKVEEIIYSTLWDISPNKKCNVSKYFYADSASDKYFSSIGDVEKLFKASPFSGARTLRYTGFDRREFSVRVANRYFAYGDEVKSRKFLKAIEEASLTQRHTFARFDSQLGGHENLKFRTFLRTVGGAGMANKSRDEYGEHWFNRDRGGVDFVNLILDDKGNIKSSEMTQIWNDFSRKIGIVQAGSMLDLLVRYTVPRLPSRPVYFDKAFYDPREVFANIMRVMPAKTDRLVAAGGGSPEGFETRVNPKSIMSKTLGVVTMEGEPFIVGKFEAELQRAIGRAGKALWYTGLYAVSERTGRLGAARITSSLNMSHKDGTRGCMESETFVRSQ